MAKELPYFKFEPNQWENGNIQMCSREHKGLFIDLCSMYWSRLGDLPLKLAVQKLCDGNATALNSLCEDRIIAIENAFIRIDFLEEQLSEFGNLSKQNSKNAREGWDKRRNSKDSSERNATASVPQCENDAIRGENMREEKKRLNKKILDKSLLSEIKISEDKNFFIVNNSKIEIEEEKNITNLKTALWFQKLFIKNLKEKNSPITHQEKATYGKYVTPIRLMFEIDKVTQDQVKQAYDYLNSLEGEFWKKNILSTETLRKKIPQLLIQKNTPNGNQSTNGTKRPAKFTIAGAEKTLLADAERKQRKMDSNDN